MEKAGKLALIFGLNVQQLLELAGDILLSNKQPAKAEVLYKISRVNLPPEIVWQTMFLFYFYHVNLRFDNLNLT